MLSAFYDYTISRVKSLFGLEPATRKRRIEDTDSSETPNVKVRRIEKPLGAKNFSGSICHSVLSMSKLDGSHLVHRKECPLEEFSWSKRNTGKENQATKTSGSQVSDSDVITLDDDLGDVSHLKACNHGFRKCLGAHSKHSEEVQLSKKHSPPSEEVHIIDEDEDVMFLRDARPRNRESIMAWSKPIQFSQRVKGYGQPTPEERQRVSSDPRTSLFGLGQPSQNQFGVTIGQKTTLSEKRLDSPSVKSRIRNGNLSRAAVLRKSLPPPPSYFGVEAKLSSRWTGLDDKLKKKPSALALCSVIDEMKAYNHMLQQFTSDFAPKQINTRFDSQAFKLFESQLKRNYSFSQLLKKKKGVSGSNVIETIDLSDDEIQEVSSLDEARGPVVEKKQDNDVVEIISRTDHDVIPIVPRKVDVQRSRERVPKASGERIEADKKPTWAPPNAVEEMIKKSHVTDEKFLKNLVDKFADEKAKIGKELEREHLKKKLWAERRQKFESSLEDRLKRYMKITDVVLEEKEISEEEEELPELTQEMLDTVHDALQKGKSCVLARLGANTITGADIQTLVNSNWLNDEVINNYMDMLTQRGQSNEYPSVYCFNTFFFPKLNSSGYSSIRRWTKKVDIFQKELLIIPLHLEIHWALAAVDFRQKSICYYDSMNGRRRTILQVILKYLQEEKNDKKKENFDVSGWELRTIQDIPQQKNGFDCGVFACMFAEHLSRGVVEGRKSTSRCKRAYPPFPFSQDNMPYFRKRMIYEILSGKLLQ